MAKGFGRSSSRHNLNSTRNNSLIQLSNATKSQSEAAVAKLIGMSGKCKECGGNCPEQMDQCLSCAMGL